MTTKTTTTTGARADAGLMTLIGLQAGVAEDIQTYASDELKERYLPGFASGESMGAMDLTEPQAGSDLGAITTRAVEQDGRVLRVDCRPSDAIALAVAEEATVTVSEAVLEEAWREHEQSG